jgi:hypothetical protein
MSGRLGDIEKPILEQDDLGSFPLLFLETQLRSDRLVQHGFGQLRGILSRCICILVSSHCCRLRRSNCGEVVVVEGKGKRGF